MSSSETESIFKEFKKLGDSPLKKNAIIQFLINDDKKRRFLQNVKSFNSKYPNLNYADLLPEVTEKDQYKLDAVIRFIQDPTNKKALNDLAKNEDPDQIEPLLAKFQPSTFEIYSDDKQLTGIIYTKGKSKMPMEEEEVAAAAAVATEEIKDVVTPKMRGSTKAKEMKEAEEKKQRQPRETVIDRVNKAEEIEREKKERDEKLSKTKVDSMGNTFESEDDPRVVEPASKSQDEIDKETDNFLDSLIKETVEEFEAEKPPPSTAIPATTIPATQPQAQAQTQVPPTQKQPQTSDKESPTGKVEETEIKDIPQDVLAIPKERASAKGKSEEQLINDIEYFFKTYPDMLDKEKAQFNKIQRGKSPALRKKQLIELHRRIVGKIGNIEDDKENKRIGIILNADKYLDNKINAILLQKLTEGLTPASLVVDVSDKTKTDSSKRVGSYQITKGRSGLLNAQKAPIYRSIPSTNDSQTIKTKRPIKLKTLPTQRWDEVNTAKKQVRIDPFIDENKRPNRFDIYL